MIGEFNINQYGAPLSALWHLEDVNDSSVNAANLTNTNSVTFPQGKFNKAASQGTGNTNKYLVRGSDVGVQGNQNFTLSFWIKLVDEIASGTWTIIHHASTSGADRYCDLNYAFNSGTQRINIDASGAASSFYNIALGFKWHHIVLQRDTSSSALYIDGDLVSTGALAGTTVGQDEFIIGAAHAGASPSSAMFDEMLLTKTVLTAKQIKEYYSWAVGRRSGIL